MDWASKARNFYIVELEKFFLKEGTNFLDFSLDDEKNGLEKGVKLLFANPSVYLNSFTIYFAAYQSNCTTSILGFPAVTNSLNLATSLNPPCPR